MVGLISKDDTGRLPPNKRLQLTAFGARDRCYFEAILCRAPWRQLKRRPLGLLLRLPLPLMAVSLSAESGKAWRYGQTFVLVIRLW